MAKKQTLTVVIATFNRSKNLRNCLNSLVNQSDGLFDVLIVDGGSTDKTVNSIDLFLKKLTIRIIVEPTPHLAYIRDLGWKNATGDIIASIDDDVIVSKNWIVSIKNALSDPKVAGVSGPTIIPKRLLSKRDVFLFYSSDNIFIKLIGLVYFNLFMQGKQFEIGKIYPSGAWSPGSNFPSSLKLKQPVAVDYLEACNYSVRRLLLKKIRGYNLHYKNTSEWCEIDLAFQLRKLGYRLLFDPIVSVEHHVSRSGVYLRRSFPIHRIYNMIYFYVRNYEKKNYLLFSLYVLFTSVYYIAMLLRSLIIYK